MTDVSNLEPLAKLISSSSQRIKDWAYEVNRIVVAHESRLTKLEPVAPPPPPSPPPPSGFEPLVGMSGPMPDDPLQAAAYFESAVAPLGCEIYRTDLAWAWMEGTRGNINYRRAQNLVDACRKHNMKCLPILGYTPLWARPGTNSDKHGPTKIVTNPDGSTTRVHDPAPFGFFCEKIASWFTSHGSDVLYGFEPLNEPNHDFLYNTISGRYGDPAQYVLLQNAAYDGIKRASNFIVIGGATAGPGYGTPGGLFGGVWNEPVMRWLEAALNGGAKFDEWSVHLYEFGDNQTATQMLRLTDVTAFNRGHWRTSVETTREQLARLRGYTGKIHVTEWGAPTDMPDGSYTPRGVKESEQALLIGKGIPLLKTAPQVGHIFVYMPKDKSTFTAITMEDHFGLIRSDGAWKPSAAAFKAAAA